ncbi:MULTISPECIES: hypothetical protein [Caproicibacterium]|uniref:Uncharacterized protein n=2 Tax=Caproicibacterium lactatifermentans TaxID=2666138 RepID=A0A859DUW3_9FIRM|nr:hypothetical protein [Caproicibacterium lactatifermentans]ARP50458.1 hypothetical protein B6259_05930 [Ruminococcaceae bacterium CPB6]MDD4807802.1 hypothetical protein [Oscillospiraceae bacterium]QKN23821.1 hypothetical protein GJQ69_04615 [Caproicibacterium lactatifermentans]
MQQKMVQAFGTTDIKEFQQKLEHGDFEKAATLDENLKDAQMEANRINNARIQPQQGVEERNK